MPGPTPRVYKTSEIKSRLLNVARPSTYMVKFTPPPAVQSFIAQRGVFTGGGAFLPAHQGCQLGIVRGGWQVM